MTTEQARRRPGRKPYPPLEFEKVLVIARTIVEHGIGDEMRRLTLFEQLDLNPNSRQSRALVTNSGRYGLTTGSYTAERIQLTPEGRLVVSGDIQSDPNNLELCFKHAIANRLSSMTYMNNSR